MRMPRRLFERLLGCSVERRPVSDTGYWSDASRIALAADTDWEQPSVPGLRELVIVQPHLFFTSPVPPTVPFHHLRLADLPLLTGAVALHRPRSEERRVGKEGVSTLKSRWSPYP